MKVDTSLGHARAIVRLGRAGVNGGERTAGASSVFRQRGPGDRENLTGYRDVGTSSSSRESRRKNRRMRLPQFLGGCVNSCRWHSRRISSSRSRRKAKARSSSGGYMRRPFRDTYVYVSSVAYASATRKAFGRKILGLTPPRISARRGKTSKRVESGLLAPRPQAVSSTKVRCVHRGDLAACRPRLCAWAGRVSTGYSADHLGHEPSVAIAVCPGVH